MTNFERLTTSPEALAQLLIDLPLEECACCSKCGQCHCYENADSCRRGIIDWLSSEADEQEDL